MGLCGFERMRREAKMQEEAKKVDEIEEQTEEEVRQKAKELGIKSWHVKNIDKLINEIQEVKNG